MAQRTIVLAGAAGDLGIRIGKALIARGAAVRALVRNNVSTSDRDRLSAMGATVAPADVANAGSVAGACEGAACVVSALNGLRDVIIDRQGVLVDVMFSEHRDMAAAKAFFESAKMVTGVTPDRVTMDGHDSYPRAIRMTLGSGVQHRDSQYLNNRLEQDHRGVKGRYGPMRGFKCPRSASEFCRAYDELRNFLRSRSRPNQKVSTFCRRLHFLHRTATVLSVLQAK